MPLPRTSVPLADGYPQRNFTTNPSPSQWEDDTPNDNLIPQSIHYDGEAVGRAGSNSRKVSWRLVDKDNNLLYVGAKGGVSSQQSDIACVFDFKINPQAITQARGTRATLYATKSAFVVDNFGTAPTTISIRQLVASGREIQTATGPVQLLTAREDIQDFIRRIYYPAIHRNFQGVLQFMDNHWERGVPTDVFFPPNGLTIQRSVDQHNVWLVEIQMVSLEKDSFTGGDGDVVEQKARTKPHKKSYIVKRGDTLEKLARKIAHRNTHRKVTSKDAERVKKVLLAYNPKLKKRRKVHGHWVKPHHLVPGEKLIIPA